MATARCLMSCVRRVVSMLCGSTAEVVSGSMTRLEVKFLWLREIWLVHDGLRCSPW